MEFRLGGEYLKAGDAEILQDFIYVKAQAVADNDKAEVLAAAAIYQLMQAGPHYCFFSDYLQQALLIDLDGGEGFGIEATDADFAVFIIFEELPPVFSGKSIQYLEADVTDGDGAVKITLDYCFIFYGPIPLPPSLKGRGDFFEGASPLQAFPSGHLQG